MLRHYTTIQHKVNRTHCVILFGFSGLADITYIVSELALSIWLPSCMLSRDG